MIIFEKTKEWIGIKFFKKDNLSGAYLGFFVLLKINSTFNDFILTLKKIGEKEYKAIVSAQNKVRYRHNKLKKQKK